MTVTFISISKIESSPVPIIRRLKWKKNILCNFLWYSYVNSHIQYIFLLIVFFQSFSDHLQFFEIKIISNYAIYSPSVEFFYFFKILKLCSLSLAHDRSRSGWRDNRNEVRTCRKSRNLERRLIRVANFNSDSRHMAALGRAAACARLTLRRSRRQAICGFCHLPIIIRCVHPGVRATLLIHSGARGLASGLRL